MYGYQGTPYNSTYTNTPGGAAAAVVSAYTTPQATAQQQASMFAGYSNALAGGATNAYANAYAAYGYGQAAAAQAQQYAAARIPEAFSATAAVSASAAPYNSYNSAYGGGGNRGGATTQAASGISTISTSNSTRAVSSTYQNKYDAAVYAAAQSYIQKQTGGGGGYNKKASFSQGSGGGGKGTFPSNNHKRFGVGANSNAHREPQQFYCETCKISCAGQLTYKEHLEGQRHKKKEALAKGEGAIALPKSKVSFRCDLCNVTCTGKDTYEAHVRGTKHQKAVALCKKLGKPIPAQEPTIIAPKDMGGTIPPLPPATSTASTPLTSLKKAIPQMHFVGGTKLSSTTPDQSAKKAIVAAAVGSAGNSSFSASEAVAGASAAAEGKGKSADLAALLAAEQNIKPVGENYVVSEKDSNGKHVTYHCKLCDCKFSDINAKDIHLKGRRHRLQYKQKVDPSLIVEIKGNVRDKKGAILKQPSGAMRAVGMPVPLVMMARPPMFGPPRPFFGPDGGMGQRFTETSDDRHIMLKHSALFLEEEEMAGIERMVQAVERALKLLSDHLEETIPSEVKKEGEPAERLLKGAMRICSLSKGILLKGEEQVELVALLSVFPTVTFLNECVELLPKFIEIEGHSVIADPSEAAIFFSIPKVACKVKILFTSPVVRAENAIVAGGDRPADILPEEKCLEALAELRHAKWFQVRCAPLQSCQVTLRILRDIRRRIPSWVKLSEWMTELLVEKVLASVGVPLPVGDALRRFFEAIASGILFSCGPGLADPCEKVPVDVLAGLEPQQREDITCSGQHALRLIAFGQIHKILGMDRIAEGTRPQLDRKRPLEKNANAEDEAKKDKPDGEEDEDGNGSGGVVEKPAKDGEGEGKAPPSTLKMEA